MVGAVVVVALGVVVGVVAAPPLVVGVIVRGAMVVVVVDVVVDGVVVVGAMVVVVGRMMMCAIALGVTAKYPTIMAEITPEPADSERVISRTRANRRSR